MSRVKLVLVAVIAALTISGCASGGDTNVRKSRILICLEQAQSASNVRLAESQCHWAESRSGGPSR